MDIVFVILHYMAIKETKQSVQYIQENIDTEQYHIIIVDNASENGTGTELQKIFQENSKITVLVNHENLGFAKGNNVGFYYAKKRWNPDYIVLMNNDVFLLEKAFLAKTKKEYTRSKFAVMGPMILTRDGRCDINPLKPEFNSAADIEKKILHYKRDLRRYQYHYAPLYYKLAGIKGVLSGWKRKPKLFYRHAENIKLHGCFLVFSQDYIQDYDGLDDSTFLFWEEEFLYKHMICDGKVLAYTPDITVFHLEDASTDVSILGKREKMIFMLRHYIDSLNSLKKVYMEYDGNNEG